MDTGLPSWVIDAARLPVAFAQVREDAVLDLAVLRMIDEPARVLMVASGGCTAAALAASGAAAHLHLVDPNPAQLAMTRLKLHLLTTAKPKERLALLGHAPLEPTDRQTRLAEILRQLDLSPDALGPIATVAELGPDHAGRYERVFAQLRSALGEMQSLLTETLRLRAPLEQGRRVGSATPLGQALDAAFDDAMALPNLVRLFSAEATQNAVEPFARHFAGRTRRVLGTLPAADNPHLWQMLIGRFPETAAYPWLTAPPPERMPEVVCSRSFMLDALRASPGGYDFVHLSNILDWLTPEMARETLALAAQALRPGGWTLIRQLNSSLDIPALGPMFTWETEHADALHGRDRSFFYRALHLGRRP